MAEGWEFRSGNDVLLVAEEDKDLARAVAQRHLSGEIEKETKRIPSQVFEFLDVHEGAVVSARIVTSGRL